MKFWLIIFASLCLSYEAVDLNSDSLFESVLAPLIVGFCLFVIVLKIIFSINIFETGGSGGSNSSGGFFDDGGGGCE
ncbi:hypothetical protein LP316_05165 [Thalassotalea sp. LPB0316]|uniref:hypothetical protein n=1 Tax=Thalassotalea sp. LPB0316 TaxID=2769490 RepID=UPI0018676C15|nr:hypothetical protein [Thalassotalea sp. LPB0316]QOL26692.1 hypothetical protein LP316_05165 [Thalassotalea sp. LPB0316]